MTSLRRACQNITINYSNPAFTPENPQLSSTPEPWQHRAILIGLGFLLAYLIGQFATKRYIPPVYWLTVTAVSIFGTMSADFLNKDLGMPLWASTVMLLVLQAAVFVAWYRTQRTLDVHSVNTSSRELFYWLTVIFTLALGTAAGDFASVTLGLGTLVSALVFLAIICLPAAGYRWLGLNAVVGFWLTVKTHVGRILAKLELRDRVQAVILACESGITRPLT